MVPAALVCARRYKQYGAGARTESYARSFALPRQLLFPVSHPLGSSEVVTLWRTAVHGRTFHVGVLPAASDVDPAGPHHGCPGPSMPVTPRDYFRFLRRTSSSSPLLALDVPRFFSSRWSTSIGNDTGARIRESHEPRIRPTTHGAHVRTVRALTRASRAGANSAPPSPPPVARRRSNVRRRLAQRRPSPAVARDRGGAPPPQRLERADQGP